MCVMLVDNPRHTYLRAVSSTQDALDREEKARAVAEKQLEAAKTAYASTVEQLEAAANLINRCN